MSHRPSTGKKIRKLEKSLRRTPPGYIDLVQFIRLRTRCTAGTARVVILSGAIKSESHTIRERFIPAHLRSTLEIGTPDVS